MRINEAKSAKDSKEVEKTKYIPSEIEPKWQAKWQEDRIYQPDLENAKRPFYNLMMFPYPSAEGLHSGNVFAFSGADVFGRYKRMQGYDVFEPIGLDGFGIHSENHALKTGTHPMDHAKRTEANFYRQLRSTGNGYAWENKVETYNPDYYQWTQWLFIELFKAGLAYKKKSPVNFCPSCKTVLADEQVIDGKCERCNSLVEKRALEQWFFKITNYAEQLLGNIEKLDWTEKVKIAQRNWIGKKTGINIRYQLVLDSPSASSESLERYSSSEVEKYITVFTTRPDTNFGATFIALAPEHELITKIISGEIRSDYVKEIDTYVEKTKSKSEIERQAEGKEKTGVFTGLYAVNELTGYKMPIWVSDFVLAGFGTGALVGVPGHDKRDFDFATKFKLEIKRVVVGPDGDKSEITQLEQVQEDEGTMINSDFLDGMDIHKATQKIMDYMEEQKYGEKTSTYHLRDWLISRQRYWGPPIPMIYCKACAKKGDSWFSTPEAKSAKRAVVVGDLSQFAGWYPEEKLPVELPFIEDYKPMGTGKAPLANYPDFYETTCPNCKEAAVRETDVSDTFLDSAWYFLRYLATDCNDLPFPSDQFTSAISKRTRFLPVTMYIGGAEHSVLHLLYARFVAMVLKDLNYIDFDEPFSKFFAHGLIIKDGAKMSKSKGNVVNPDDYIRKFGVDAVRCYLLFLGPFSHGGDFRDTGMEGMARFLKRVWVMFSAPLASEKLSQERVSLLNETIKGITEDYEALRYNTILAKLMTWYNLLVKQESVTKEEAEVFTQLLAPLAPHMTEELWERFGNPFSIHTSSFPEFNEKQIVHNVINLAVQVNGKLRGVLVLDQNSPKDEKGIQELAKQDPAIAKFLEGKSIKKVIYIVGKIINFVVG